MSLTSMSKESYEDIGKEMVVDIYNQWQKLFKRQTFCVQFLNRLFCYIFIAGNGRPHGDDSRDVL